MDFRLHMAHTEDGFTVELIQDGEIVATEHGSLMRGDTPGSLVDHIMADN